MNISLKRTHKGIQWSRDRHSISKIFWDHMEQVRLDAYVETYAAIISHSDMCTHVWQADLTFIHNY